MVSGTEFLWSLNVLQLKSMNYPNLSVVVKTLVLYITWVLLPQYIAIISHSIHVWYIIIHLHLVDFYGKCREIYH